VDSDLVLKANLQIAAFILLPNFIACILWLQAPISRLLFLGAPKPPCLSNPIHCVWMISTSWGRSLSIRNLCLGPVALINSARVSAGGCPLSLSLVNVLGGSSVVLTWPSLSLIQAWYAVASARRNCSSCPKSVFYVTKKSNRVTEQTIRPSLKRRKDVLHGKQEKTALYKKANDFGPRHLFA